MRNDAIGLFWQDLPTQRGRGQVARVMPPIPDTGWEAPKFFPNLQAARSLTIDVETYDPELTKVDKMPARGPGWARGKGHLVGLAVGTDDGHRWYFPMRHEVEPETNLNPDHVLAWARDNLRYKNQPKIGANIMYDVGWLEEEGVNVAGELIDVQYAEALLSEADKVGLDAMSEKYLGVGKTTSDLYQWCSDYYGGPATDKQRANIYRTPPRLAGPYAESDVDLPQRLAPILYRKLKEENLTGLFDMECRLIRLMLAMRRAGVQIDINRAGEIRANVVKETEKEKVKLFDMFGQEVNVNSNDDLASGFDRLGLKYGYTEAGNPSFAKDFLKSVTHPVGKQIIAIRELEKLVGTFIDSYLINSHVNGSLYGQFHTLRGVDKGARSGRLSSSTPNLQNIPTRTALGNMIRELFIPSPGHLCWRKYDYSQIEYRFLAHFAVGPGADELRARYNNDPRTDYHAETQQLVQTETGQELKRKPIKNINFGLIYGMGEKRLSKNLGITLKEGKKLFAAYHRGVPFAKATMEQSIEQALGRGYVETIFGRRSRFDLWEPAKIDWDNRKPAVSFDKALLWYGDIKRAYSHKALNRRLQGSAAEMMKAAMLKCWDDGIFDVTGVPRLTVHDELDFSDPGGVDYAFDEVKRTMENVIKLNVPVIVDEERGPNWGTVKEIAA